MQVCVRPGLRKPAGICTRLHFRRTFYVGEIKEKPFSKELTADAADGLCSRGMIIVLCRQWFG
jgi:hypothetical protein